jgi:hypothetical protein
VRVSSASVIPLAPGDRLGGIAQPAQRQHQAAPQDRESEDREDHGIRQQYHQRHSARCSLEPLRRLGRKPAHDHSPALPQRHSDAHGLTAATAPQQCCVHASRLLRKRQRLGVRRAGDTASPGWRLGRDDPPCGTRHDRA